MARVTVVNDNAEFLELVNDILEGDQYDTTLIDGDRPDTIALIRSSEPDLLMIDVRLGVDGDHGWEIAQEVRAHQEFAGLPVLLCSADPPKLRAIEEGLEPEHRVATLEKPFSIDQLTDAIDDLLADPSVA
jgi:CheY-like chemotaxis protein